MNRIEQFYDKEEPTPLVTVSAKYFELSLERKRKLLAMLLGWASKELAKIEDVPTDKDE
jgi:hypothetical protein